MRWFSHRRSLARDEHCTGRRRRGRLPKEVTHFSRFLSPVTLTFYLKIRTPARFYHFCTMHLTDKFHHPMSNRSEVIVRTNRQTNWQTNRRRWKHPPRFTMLRRWVQMSLCCPVPFRYTARQFWGHKSHCTHLGTPLIKIGHWMSTNENAEKRNSGNDTTPSKTGSAQKQQQSFEKLLALGH